MGAYCSPMVVRSLSTVLVVLGLVGGCTDSGGESNGAWVVNAAISANDAQSAYLAGYGSDCGCSLSEAGFVKHLDADGTWNIVHRGWSPLNAVWVSEPEEVVAVGSMGDISILAGEIWKETSLDDHPVLVGVWGSSIKDVFAVGHEGAVLHYDGVSWDTMESSSTANLHAVWGTATDNVYAVGEGGTILHYDGSAWSAMRSGTTESLNDIWGNDEDDVYVVGGSETTKRHVILHFDGADWQSVRSGEPYELLGIHGRAKDDIYAVGAERLSNDSVKSAVLHFDGSEWSYSSPNIGQFLWDVWAPKAGGYYVVGPDNTVEQLK